MSLSFLDTAVSRSYVIINQPQESMLTSLYGYIPSDVLPLKVMSTGKSKLSVTGCTANFCAHSGNLQLA